MDINAYVNTLNDDQKTLFNTLYKLIYDVYPEVVFMIFVKQPYFYLKQHESIKPHYRPSVMMSIFKDHINIFTSVNQKFSTRLNAYKFTEKNTLQLYFHDVIVEDVLKQLFKEALQS